MIRTKKVQHLFRGKDGQNHFIEVHVSGQFFNSHFIGVADMEVMSTSVFIVSLVGDWLGLIAEVKESATQYFTEMQTELQKAVA